MFVRRLIRKSAVLFPPAAALVREWDDMRRRVRHLEAIASESHAVDQARRHFAAAVAQSRDLPDAGDRWSEYSAIARAAMGKLISPLEAIRFAQDPSTHNGFEVRDKRAVLADLAEEQENTLRREFPQYAATLPQWSESIYADPASMIEHRGRLVSSPMYLLTRFAMRCLERCRPETVCEIGGGYGAPARLWLTNPIHRPAKYVIVDLPESLFFAELYLGMHFGVEEVCYVADRSPATAERIARARIVLCPNGLIDMLEPVHFDLVVNTNSMQEMSEAYIDFFMAWLDRQPCKLFFSSNYALQDARDLRESRNLWSPRPSRQWKTVSLEHNPDAGYPSNSAFYEKSPDDVAERIEDARVRFLELHEQPLTPQRLASMIDLVRLEMDRWFIGQLLVKVRAEVPFLPKEALYLEAYLEAR